jgi:hypothetical protein
MASFFICLVSQISQVSSQGYMGTITTGTGIVPPITVGLSSGATESVGALSSLANLTGTWSIDLRDSAAKHIDLQVLQNKELIMGYGDMTQNGAREKVTASGFLAGERPTLFVSIVDRPEVYGWTWTPLVHPSRADMTPLPPEEHDGRERQQEASLFHHPHHPALDERLLSPESAILRPPLVPL